MLWKVYFVLILLEAIGIPLYTVASSFIEEPTFTSQIGIHFVFGILGVVGLYGFVFEKPLLTKPFWSVVAPLFVVWNVLVEVNVIRLYPGEILTGTEIIISIVWLIFYLPQFYALVSYAFKSGNP